MGEDVLAEKILSDEVRNGDNLIFDLDPFNDKVIQVLRVGEALSSWNWEKRADWNSLLKVKSEPSSEKVVKSDVEESSSWMRAYPRLLLTPEEYNAHIKKRDL